MQQSMFQRFGGAEAVAGLVLRFYDRVLAAERLSPYFRNCDMRRLIEHQAKYLSAVMGGPASYSEDELREMHAHLGVTGGDFDEMLRQLRGAMEEAGFAREDIDVVMRRYASLRRVIVTR